MSSDTSEQLGPIATIPVEILRYIFNYLPTIDFVAQRRVNKRHRQIIVEYLNADPVLKWLLEHPCSGKDPSAKLRYYYNLLFRKSLSLIQEN